MNRHIGYDYQRIRRLNFNAVCSKWHNGFLSLLQPHFFKAAARVVESKRARTTQDKPNGNNIEMETEANLDVGKRFVNSLICFLLHGYIFNVKVLLVSHF